MSRPRSGNLQSYCRGKLGLPLIERPKGLGLELKGRGNVQAVQRSHAEARTMPAGQFRAGIPNGFWKVDREPESASQIACQFGLCASSFERSNLLAENMLRDGVHPFGAMEGSKPDPRF